MRIQAVKLSGAEQTLNGRRPFPRTLRPGEQPVFLPNGDGPNRVLHRIVVDRQHAAVGIAHQRGPALDAVVEGLGRAASLGNSASSYALKI